MKPTTSLATALLIPLLFGINACSDRSAETTTSDKPAASAAADDPRAITGYSAEKVADHTWVIHGPLALPNVANKGFMNNPAFIVTDEGVVVIDPGSSVHAGNMVISEIRKVTDKPVIAAFNTHVHGDHWLGNDALQKENPAIVIYAHPKMMEKIDNGAGEQWVDMMSTLTEGATDETRIIKPSLAAEHGQVIDIAGHEFEIVHLGKAHTEGDIMVLHRTDNVLYTGDNAGYGRVLRLDDGSFKGNAEALQAGLDLNPKIVVPGHGPTGGAEILSSYKNYLTTIYSAVEEGYEEDMSDFEIKPAVHELLVDYHEWSGYEEEIGKHVSLSFLEIESADF